MRRNPQKSQPSLDRPICNPYGGIHSRQISLKNEKGNLQKSYMFFVLPISSRSGEVDT